MEAVKLRSVDVKLTKASVEQDIKNAYNQLDTGGKEFMVTSVCV